MKTTIVGFALIIIANTSCNTGSKENTNGNEHQMDTLANVTNQVTPTAKVHVNGIIDGYLRLKNALASDNGKDAAIAGNEILKAMETIDTTHMSAAQKSAYMGVLDDIKENAEHISTNGGEIEHQREHFGMLSKDVYDLVKAFGNGKPLFKDYCPMAFDKRGAIWLSEIEEIRNPYFGSEMPKCGEVKEKLN